MLVEFDKKANEFEAPAIRTRTLSTTTWTDCHLCHTPATYTLEQLIYIYISSNNPKKFLHNKPTKRMAIFCQLSNAVSNLIDIYVYEYNKYTYNYIYVPRIAVKVQFGLGFLSLFSCLCFQVFSFLVNYFHRLIKILYFFNSLDDRNLKM